MTLFIAFILLRQFDWSWPWYAVAVILWALHYQLHAVRQNEKFKDLHDKMWRIAKAISPDLNFD